jgi:Bacterial regulatory proteins, lacI family
MPMQGPGEARQVALCGLRWWAGEGVTAIARRMGVSYSAVSRRVTQRLREDPQFRTRVERVIDVKLKT